MAATLDAYRQMWINVRKDVENIAKKAIIALDNVDSCDKNTWTVTFTVLSAVAYLAATIPAAAVPMSAVAGAFSFLATQNADIPDKSELPFGGGDAYQIVGGVIDAIEKVKRDIEHTERRIAGVLMKTHQNVADHLDRFIPLRPPTLATIPRSELTSDKGLGTNS